MTTLPALLETLNITKSFRPDNASVEAVKNISFTIAPGECLGLVGTSGCGKSTLAQILMGITEADSGTVLFDEQAIDFNDTDTRKNYYRNVQMVFQNPLVSFHPRKTIGTAIMLPLLNYGYTQPEATEKLAQLLTEVGLTQQHAAKFPHQLSGGECQRAAIARAISIEPKLLICDEITSALDMQIQAEIVQLLLNLQAETKMSMFFISHDIVLVQELCQRLLIMRSGAIIESGTAHEIITAPQQEYTKNLIGAALNLTINR
ncbi:dipeptide/oligopeptide/nickel ABC transporter ATP-binding protein [Phascolarctobacterium sp.]|uniref:ABC transporter ATP-binding protein n=1 Tax=Phascolarctobacterium sp. TaxID=2049039 RepID=UPI0015B16813|nr:dipeptide/oligopeptide/nickel ABC transporter ATP-binding protein [uncultured Phascolarctobacterium sp.]